MAAALAGTSTERLQHFLRDADWNAHALDQLRVPHLITLSPAGGMLALDDTGLLKQGCGSVGVARQYGGVLGKVANCQAVVTAEYIADHPTLKMPWHWPVSAQLSLPEAWDADTERREHVHVPEGTPVQTKQDVALLLIDRARQWPVPFKLVLADAGYGRNANFLKGLEERQLLSACGVE